MKDKGKKILIAEDDKFIAEMYVTKLSQEGFEVQSVHDGQAACEKIFSENPDIVLLDIQMPKMDGIEVLQKIRSDEKIGSLPVIILTNANEKDQIEKAMEMGANGYLIKSSYTPDEVVLKINEALDDPDKTKK